MATVREKILAAKTAGDLDELLTFEIEAAYDVDVIDKLSELGVIEANEIPNEFVTDTVIDRELERQIPLSWYVWLVGDRFHERLDADLLRIMDWDPQPTRFYVKDDDERISDCVLDALKQFWPQSEIYDDSFYYNGAGWLDKVEFNLTKTFRYVLGHAPFTFA